MRIVRSRTRPPHFNGERRISFGPLSRLSDARDPTYICSCITDGDLYYDKIQASGGIFFACHYWA